MARAQLALPRAVDDPLGGIDMPRVHAPKAAIFGSPRRMAQARWATDDDRFIASLGERIDVDRDTGCWNWLGATNRQGYGQVYVKDGREARVHSVVYDILNRTPVRDGMHLHHVCENRRCCNPMHLRELTPSEHMTHHQAQRTGQ